MRCGEPGAREASGPGCYVDDHATLSSAGCTAFRPPLRFSASEAIDAIDTAHAILRWLAMDEPRILRAPRFWHRWSVCMSDMPSIDWFATTCAPTPRRSREARDDRRALTDRSQSLRSCDQALHHLE